MCDPDDDDDEDYGNMFVFAQVPNATDINSIASSCTSGCVAMDITQAPPQEICDG